MPTPPDDARLLLAARIAFAGAFLFTLMVLVVAVFLAPLVVEDYRADPVLVVPTVTLLAGAVLMLLGIETVWNRDLRDRFKNGTKKDDGDDDRD